MSARWRTDKGNSLTEVMVCMVIVTLVATATTKGMVYTTEVVGENTMHQEAIVRGQQVVERLRTASFDTIRSGTTISGGYQINQTVTENTPETGMKHIHVTVNWNWKGQARKYELTTIFAKLTKS